MEVQYCMRIDCEEREDRRWWGGGVVRVVSEGIGRSSRSGSL